MVESTKRHFEEHKMAFSESGNTLRCFPINPLEARL